MGEGQDPNEPVSLEAILEVVYIYFNGDRTQVNGWLKTPHGELGGLAPLSLIQRGKPDKLVNVIRTMLGEIERR